MYGNPYGDYQYLNSRMPPNNPYLQNYMNPPMNPASPPTPGPAFLQVGTAKEFDNVTIQPGKQVLIMAQNDPYIAFKSADGMGMVTTSLYRLEPVTAEQINGPAPEYVTRQEFQQTIKQLLDNLNKPTRMKKETAE